MFILKGRIIAWGNLFHTTCFVYFFLSDIFHCDVSFPTQKVIFKRRELFNIHYVRQVFQLWSFNFACRRHYSFLPQVNSSVHLPFVNVAMCIKFCMTFTKLSNIRTAIFKITKWKITFCIRTFQILQGVYYHVNTSYSEWC